MNGERGPLFPAFALWGAFLAVLTAIGVIFFSPSVSTPALLGGAAAFILALALGLAVTKSSLQTDGGGADPDISPATVWLSVSLVLMVLGAALGLWLVFIGGGMAGIGLGALLRETRAQSRAAREAGAGR
jgi:hypothetical protein